MSMIVVHGIPGSPYVRMPLLACEEKGAPYRLAGMQFGQNKTPDYLARHPFGRIPVIEHDDFWLYESAAIIRYIDAVFPGPSLTPAAPRAQARMNQVMGIIDWYVMPTITSAIGWNRVIAPMIGRPVDEAAVANAVPGATTCIRALEQLLGTAPYMTGESVSLADLMLSATSTCARPRQRARAAGRLHRCSPGSSACARDPASRPPTRRNSWRPRADRWLPGVQVTRGQAVVSRAPRSRGGTRPRRGGLSPVRGPSGC